MSWRQVMLSDPPELLFQRLQSQLKAHKLRLQHLFDKFDTDGSGLLDTDELAKLLQHLLPKVATTPATFCHPCS